MPSGRAGHDRERERGATIAGALVLLRLLLAGLLLTAGIGKLLDREGGRESLRAFGVPERLVGPVALLLPVIELVIAVGLIPPATARWAALAAAASMAVFSTVIARALMRGERVECHCFGALSDSPAGPAALIRNLLIAVAALLVACAPGAPGPAVTTWLGNLYPPSSWRSGSASRWWQCAWPGPGSAVNSSEPRAA